MEDGAIGVDAAVGASQFQKSTKPIEAVTPSKTEFGIRTLVATWSDDPMHVRDALLAGAKGYLVHGRFDPADLASATRALALEDISMMPVIAAGIIRESDRIPVTELTKRELWILKLVQRGRSNRDIAREMGIEEKTVKNHINSIYSKLGVASRIEAMTARIEGPGA